MSKHVSIIIPTYNGQETIEETLRSVIAQTYRSYEIIIVDDGSKDSTLKIVNQIAPFAKVIQQKNQGTMAARQNGINSSTGELIAFLDQDDIWFNNHLDIAVNFFNSHPEYGLFVANMEAIDEKGNKLNFEVVPNPEKYSPTFESMLLIQPIATSTTVFNRKVVEEIGGLSTAYGFSGAMGDLDFFIQVSEITQLYFDNKSLGLYRWSETRPGRLLSFLENLKIYAKKFWKHPRVVTKEDLRQKFVQACCNYGLHIYRLLLKQYNNEISLPILELLNEDTKYMQALFGDIYRSQIGLQPLDLALFNLEKESTRVLLFIYLLRKDLQDAFPSVFKGSLEELEIWASEVVNRKHVDGDFSSLQKYVRDFSYKSAKLSPQKKWAIFRIELDQKKNQFRQKFAGAVHRVLPEGTRRRRFLYPLVLGAKVLFFEGWGDFIKKTWNYIVVSVHPSIVSIQKRVYHTKKFLIFSLNLQKKNILSYIQ